LAQQLIRKAGGAGVHVLGRSGEAPEQHERTLPAGEPRAYLGSVAFVAVSLGIALLLHQVLGLASVAMTFLTAVLVSAVVYGLWPALVASFASVLAYNFFFLPPVHTHHRRSRNVVARCSSSASPRRSPAIHRAGAVAGDRAGAGRTTRSYASSVAGWRVRPISTICCGRPCIRSR
jgi:hypothetical protein